MKIFRIKIGAMCIFSPRKLYEDFPSPLISDVKFLTDFINFHVNIENVLKRDWIIC